MVNSLESLIASCMQRNPALSLPQAVGIAKDFLRSQDPHNVSYTSSHSGRGAPGRDSASALLYVPETPKALDLVSKEGGGAACWKVLLQLKCTLMQAVPLGVMARS